MSLTRDEKKELWVDFTRQYAGSGAADAASEYASKMVRRLEKYLKSEEKTTVAKYAEGLDVRSFDDSEGFYEAMFTVPRHITSMRLSFVVPKASDDKTLYLQYLGGGARDVTLQNDGCHHSLAVWGIKSDTAYTLRFKFDFTKIVMGFCPENNQVETHTICYKNLIQRQMAVKEMLTQLLPRWTTDNDKFKLVEAITNKVQDAWELAERNTE